MHTMYRTASDFAIVLFCIKIVLLAICKSDYMDPLDTPVYVIILIAAFGMRLLQSGYSYWLAVSYKGSWEKSTLKKHRRMKKDQLAWREIRLSKVQVGDIVRVKYCEVCPADLLILDTSEQRYNDNIFKTNERKIKGENRIRIKRAIRNLDLKQSALDTKSPEYLSRLTRTLNGYIEYEPPSGTTERFSGEFKLKNDPKITNITDENILFCGSKLYSKEVVGMVLYTGNHTKIFQKNYIQKYGMHRIVYKTSRIGRYARNYSLLFLGVSVLLSSIFMIVLYTQSGLLETIQAIEARLVGFSHFKKYLSILTFLLNFIPAPMIIVQDVYCLLVSLLMRYRRVEMSEEEPRGPDEAHLAAQSKISSMQQSASRRKRTSTMGRSTINQFMSSQALAGALNPARRNPHPTSRSRL